MALPGNSALPHPALARSTRNRGRSWLGAALLSVVILVLLFVDILDPCQALGFTLPRSTASSLRITPARTSPSLTVEVPSVGARKGVTARRIFGLGTAEIFVVLAVGALVLGPDALKGFAKEAGKAAGDLKEVPQAFQEGMDTIEATKEKKDGDDAKLPESDKKASGEKAASKDEKSK
mmetsp:Transcript_8880/g.19506  ORF Transcript_8880/g.19506 Transcript_8880/m.19506 type:complete len:178 (-) Transcript_8880:117-650(-)